MVVASREPFGWMITCGAIVTVSVATNVYGNLCSVAVAAPNKQLAQFREPVFVVLAEIGPLGVGTGNTVKFVGTMGEIEAGLEDVG